MINIAEPASFDPRSLAQLASICREHNVQIWHGHDYKTNVFGVMLQPWLGYRLVSTVHGWVSHEGRLPLYYALDRWALRRHERVITVSHDLFVECQSAGIREGVLRLVENGIDTEEFHRRTFAANSARRLGVPTGRLIVGAAGRLAEEKGFDLLIEAAGRLMSEGIDFELWIAGEGREKVNLLDCARKTGHLDRIKFTGFEADMKEFYGALDIFCLSSRREGLPNVLLEAMAMEVPAVSTSAGGILPFAAGRDDILIVPTEDRPALTGALRSLLLDPSLRRSLAVKARKRVEEECSFRTRMQKMAAVYDELNEN